MKNKPIHSGDASTVFSFILKDGKQWAVLRSLDSEFQILAPGIRSCFFHISVLAVRCRSGHNSSPAIIDGELKPGIPARREGELIAMIVVTGKRGVIVICITSLNDSNSNDNNNNNIRIATGLICQLFKYRDR